MLNQFNCYSSNDCCFYRSRIQKLSDITRDIQQFAVVDKLQLMMAVLKGDRKNVSFCGKGIESTMELMANLVNMELSAEMFAAKIVDHSDNCHEELIKRILLSVQSTYKVSVNDEMDVYNYLVHMNDAIDKLQIANVSLIVLASTILLRNLFYSHHVNISGCFLCQ